MSCKISCREGMITSCCFECDKTRNCSCYGHKPCSEDLISSLDYKKNCPYYYKHSIVIVKR